MKGLTPKQARAIAFLLTSKTLVEAAKASGIAERTLYEWLNQTTFRQELRRAERGSVENASRRLVAGQNKALDALEGLITKGRNEGVKRAAAMDWLNMLLKYRDLGDIEERLSRLERAQNGK